MAANEKRYYFDGSTVRVMEPEILPEMPEQEEAVPARRPERKRQPERRHTPERKPVHRRAVRRQADRRWVDEMKLGMFLTAAAVVVAGLCLYVLKINADIRQEKNNISNLQAQLETQLNANADYSSGLESLTDVDEIYKVATQELGMVYSKPGQTAYYSQNNDDYVIQYQDIPEAK